MQFGLMLALTAPVAARELPGGLGTLPPLAWSSWNVFATGINENTTLEIGDQLLATGLAALGYQYVNIDAGIWHTERDSSTQKILPDPHKFPRGLRYVADRLHAKGLRFGIYTDISDHSCGTGPGSLGHYELDAATFAHDFNADYLKVDFCGPTSGLNPTPFNQSCAPGALTMGGDIYRANMTVGEATAWCADRTLCEGFTTHSSANQTCGAVGASTVFEVYFKDSDARPNGDPVWTHYIKPGAGRVSYQPAAQYDAWNALGRALNATGRPIYYSICPHSNLTHGEGTSVEWLGSLPYSPPVEWTADQRYALVCICVADSDRLAAGPLEADWWSRGSAACHPFTGSRSRTRFWSSTPIPGTRGTSHQPRACTAASSQT